MPSMDLMIEAFPSDKSLKLILKLIAEIFLKVTFKEWAELNVNFIFISCFIIRV